MANTYTQLYVQIVFAVKGRQHLIPKEYKDDVQKYITGIIQNRQHKLLAINCMPDHIHIFIGLHPAQSISDLVNAIKTASNKFIKSQYWMPYSFSWQRGFGAFSYSRSAVDNVVKYINNQEIHHRKKNFESEYRDFLEEFFVEYDDRYLFEFYT